MKKFRTITTAILAIAMIFALALPAFAADTYTITINKETAGHRYEAYQIFTGDVSVDPEDAEKLVLSSIKWGSGVTADGQAAMGNAQDKADTIITVAKAEAFADEVAPYLTSTKATAKTPAKNTIPHK